MPRKETYSGPISAQAQQDLVSEGIENFELPKSVVTKIAKSAIPENIKLQKETVLSLVKGSTVFINYLAATAHDVAISKQHKSISASDVLKALEMLEFGDMANRLQAELVVYRDVSKNDNKGKKSNNASTSASVKKSASTAAPNAGGPVSTSSKSKGKEKATNPLPPPFTSAPLEHHHLSSASGWGAAAQADAMEVDDEDTAHVTHIPPGEVNGDGLKEEGLENDQEVIDQEIEEDEEPEELRDTVALEEEELRRDGRGLDDRHPGMVVEDDE